uniref:CCHC-type domain-containing protein n=1 Tax=Fagus sylvatica TaxID=28930 RepID=A0A2N9EXZ4_FAGSY
MALSHVQRSIYVMKLESLTLNINAEYTKWMARDKTLLTMLNATLSPSVLSMVVGQKSARGVWDTLEKRFTSVNRSNILNLKMDLHGLMKNNDSIDLFLQRVKESRDKLEAVDVHISDEEILHVVLKGLPIEFHSIRSAIRTRNDPISFDELRVLLFSRMKNSLKTSVEPSKDLPLMAMLSTGNRFQSSQSPPQFNNSSNRGRGRNSNGRGRGGRGYSHNGRGGFQNQNNYSSTNSSNTGNQSQHPYCQICGKVGHLALDCYHRMELQLSRSSSSSKISCTCLLEIICIAPPISLHLAPLGLHRPLHLGCISSLPLASLDQGSYWLLLVTTKSPSTTPSWSHNQAPSNTTWVSDTGATYHFKPDLNNLNHLVDYQGSDQVSLGNGISIASKYLEWQSAMSDEYTAFQRQQTWSLVSPRSNHNIVGCYHQQAGLDNDETFSPVVKPAIVCLILSPAQFRWPLQQLDVSNTFLHGILCEDVYMMQPQGFIDSAHPTHVYKLHKSLYGLKQAPRAWFERFTSQLLVLGFTASKADPSFFVYRSSSTVIFLLIYVDDIIITGNSSTALALLVRQLAASFDLKDLGPLTYFLGLEIDYSSNGFFVH